MTETFDIAGYCRISVDDELDRDNVSIENQKAIIQDFVKQKFPGTGTAPATPSSSGRATRPCGGVSCPTSTTSWW